MMYADLNGLAAYMGEGAYEAWLGAHTNAIGEVEDCEARILACIMPMQPRTEAQTAAFSRAVYAQMTQDWVRGVPPGLKKFSLGSFSAELDGGSDLCPTARALLLDAGLLYRGVAAC